MDRERHKARLQANVAALMLMQAEAQAARGPGSAWVRITRMAGLGRDTALEQADDTGAARKPVEGH